MKLSPSQLKEFGEQGYLFFPNCFSEEEIALLRDDAEAILKLDRQEVWREKTGAPRTAFAAHTFNETFRLLASHPRVVEPLRQLFVLMILSRTARSAAAFGGLRSLTRSSARTECCPCDQGRILGAPDKKDIEEKCL